MKSDYIDGLVSVIMPAYNAEDYIVDSILSAINQSYDGVELIVIDDCSTDNTVLTVKERFNDDDRVKLIINSNNSGPGISRNNGIKTAKGRFIAFLDSDDIWLSEKLSRQISFMGRNKSGFSFTQYRRFRTSIKDVGHLINIPNSLDYKGLLKNTAIATSSVVIDRKIIGDIPLVRVSKEYIEDYILYYQILKKGFNALGLKNDLLRYRVVSDSFSRNKANYSLKVWRTYREIEGLNLFHAFYYFSSYAIRAVIKYARF